MDNKLLVGLSAIGAQQVAATERTDEAINLLFLVPGGTYFHLESSHAVHTRLRKY